MDQRTINRLLRELTPEIRAYLFPGMPPGGLLRGEPPVYGSALPGPMAMLDMALERQGTWEEEIIQERERKPGNAREPIFDWHKPGGSRRREAMGTDSEVLDPRTEQILAEIRRLQEKFGVSIEELDVIMGYTVRLSPMHISRSGKVVLPEYDGVEVKMPNISKALYFLYLRHPEGMRFKDVADYRDELLGLYGSITGRDDPAEIEKSIDLLVDPFGNALNVNASRIKTAFRNVVSDRIARFYYLTGGAGETKQVPLDRDLVVWDY